MPLDIRETMFATPCAMRGALCWKLDGTDTSKTPRFAFVKAASPSARAFDSIAPGLLGI